MTDTKLSALSSGTTPQYFYGSESGGSKKYTAMAVVNVKDYGAVGNGSTDDTANIQAAFDAAWGALGSTNGPANAKLNKQVYFPPGEYIVTPPASTKTITNVANSGGFVQYTVNDVNNLTVGQRIHVDGVVATFDNVNGSCKITAINTGSKLVTVNQGTSAGSYTSGGTMSSICLFMNNVHGSVVFGAGNGSTVLHCPTSGGVTLASDGFQYSTIRDFSIAAGGPGSRCIALCRFQPAATHAATVQSVTLSQIKFFASTSTGNLDYGLGLATGSNGTDWGQGSEIIIQNCYFEACLVYGMSPANANALGITVLGGNFAGCGVGILDTSGSTAAVIATGFQNNTVDIKATDQAHNAMSVMGCRSESANFIQNVAGRSMIIGGIRHHRGYGSRGYFYDGSGGGTIHISGCDVNDGRVKVQEWTRLCIQACNFGGESSAGDWLDVSNVASWRPGVANGGQDPRCQIEIENVVSQTGGGTWTMINKQRKYTNNQSTVVTENYNVT